MARHRFPESFRWGAATAAYAIEGSPRADGKGESIWDHFSHRPGTVAGGETGDRACDSYRRRDADLGLLRELGATSHRFSIAWPRIQPEGLGAPCPAGLDHYRRWIETLLDAGIEPFPTLYHWDLPQGLERRGGWPARDTAGRFADYADLLARALGDVVERWCLLDSPGLFTRLGYRDGVHAPGRSDAEACWRATHTANLAQAEGFRALRASCPAAKIGSALWLSHGEPAGDAEADLEATERWHAVANAWFLEPLLHGRYPEAVGELPPLGLARDDLERLRAPLDFIGINYAGTTRVRARVESGRALRAEALDETDTFRAEPSPHGLKALLERLARDYPGLDLEITADGCRDDSAPVSASGAATPAPPPPDARVQDGARCAYHREHLASLAAAIEAGLPLRSYHAWSLLDHFAWAEGSDARYGLAWVDFPSGRRILKASGRWLAEVIGARGFET